MFPKVALWKKKKKKKMKPLMVEHVLGVQMWKRSELTEGLVPGYRGRGFWWEEICAILTYEIWGGIVVHQPNK